MATAPVPTEGAARPAVEASVAGAPKLEAGARRTPQVPWKWLLRRAIKTPAVGGAPAPAGRAASTRDARAITTTPVGAPFLPPRRSPCPRLEPAVAGRGRAEAWPTWSSSWTSGRPLPCPSWPASPTGPRSWAEAAGANKAKAAVAVAVEAVVEAAALPARVVDLVQERVVTPP